MNNSNDCGVFNTAFEVSLTEIRGISVPDSVKAIPFFANSDNGFVSMSFDKHPIAQQVYDSEFWNGESGTTTTTAPAWFSSMQKKITMLLQARDLREKVEGAILLRLFMDHMIARKCGQ